MVLEELSHVGRSTGYAGLRVFGLTYLKPNKHIKPQRWRDREVPQNYFSEKSLSQDHTANAARTPLTASLQLRRVRRRRPALQRLQARFNAERPQEVRLRHRAVAGDACAPLLHCLPAA